MKNINELVNLKPYSIDKLEVEHTWLITVYDQTENAADLKVVVDANWSVLMFQIGGLQPSLDQYSEQGLQYVSLTPEMTFGFVAALDEFRNMSFGGKGHGEA